MTSLLAALATSLDSQAHRCLPTRIANPAKREMWMWSPLVRLSAQLDAPSNVTLVASPRNIFTLVVPFKIRFYQNGGIRSNSGIVKDGRCNVTQLNPIAPAQEAS